MAALIEQVQVEVAQCRPVPVGVVENEGRRTWSAVQCLEPVAGRGRAQGPLPQAAWVDLAHGGALQGRAVGLRPGDNHVHLACARPQRPDDAPLATEDGMRVVMASLHQHVGLMSVKAAAYLVVGLGLHDYLRFCCLTFLGARAFCLSRSHIVAYTLLRSRTLPRLCSRCLRCHVGLRAVLPPALRAIAATR